MTTSFSSRLMSLARAETAGLVAWLGEKSVRSMLPLLVGIVAGCGLYGFAIEHGFDQVNVEGGKRSSKSEEYR